MIHTYCDNVYIYSVDMMFAYIKKNKKKISEVHINVSEFANQLNNAMWGNPEKNIKYSPMSVITDSESNQQEYNRILKTDMSHPIIISAENGNVIDGMHRLSKAYLEKNLYIVAYMFDSTIMKKFIIGKKDEWKKVNSMHICDFINLFVERFYEK